MGRSGSKKIVKYFCGWMIAVVILTVAFLAFTAYEEAINQKQMERLLSSHPELEADIVAVFQKTPEINLFGNKTDTIYSEQIRSIQEKYGYRFYESAVVSSILYLYLFLLLCSFLGVIFFIWREHRKAKKISDDNDILLEALSEELNRFKRGDFCASQKYPVYGEYSEKWISIWESLRELGFYFNDLRDRIWQEENHTKTLITDISHQLKTPLASLHMSHELMLDDNLTKEERLEFQEQEEQEIQKLEILLSELVKLSRLENQMIKISPERQNIRATIAEAVSLVYGKAKVKQIQIQVEIQEDYLILHDRKWTAEAISNILDNAIKYSEEKTNINVRVHQLTSTLLIEIEDEGIGIPPEELHNIFKRFYRGKNAQSMEKDGVGVGLYLARNIIEQQNGTITAKRKPDKGTVFRITFPL